MKLRDRQAVGQKVAGLVVQAEQEMPNAPGWRKRQWVMTQARVELDLEDSDPSAVFGRWLGVFLLRIAIEVAHSMLEMLSEHVEDLANV